MENYKEIIKRYKKNFLDRQNVVGLGYGIKEKNGKRTGDEALVVLVKKKVPNNKLRKKDIIPQTLASYQTDVIEVGELKFMDLRTARTRPAQPGISIGHYKISAGTFGAVVKDKRNGQKLILSNNHVLANISNGRDNRAAKGDPILQPGIHDKGNNPDDVLASLERFIPIYRSEDEPDCNIAIAIERIANLIIHILRPYYNFKLLKEGRANIVDAAVAKPSSNSLIKSDILQIGRVKGVRDAEVDMKVRKSGRTTGLTEGKVVAVDASVTVNMSDKDKATFEDQIITTPISSAGDSGSLVLDMDNNAVGLLFAGSEQATVCNKITNVLDALDIEF
ncbi:chymotrypsin family serine protease [Natronospora cellulosivora (SeqCode)]